jgi:alkaline phosphatase D
MMRRMSSLELDRRLADLAAPRTRRGVLIGAGSLAAAAALSRLPLDLAYGGPPRHRSYPFTLGVASGDPRRDGVVLWTRLAPEPLRADGGMEPRPVEVRWELAKDPWMRRLVRRGRATAWPSFAHSVHVEVDGLDDGREYFYRFTSGSAASPVGLTRTAPRGRVNELTFSFVTCQKWDDGFYPAYREIAREDLDFVIHLGDYTYEYGIANNTGPRNPDLPPEFTTETTTLARYRLQHALYKTDPHLQAAHRAHPFIVIWDDHEVVNDYVGEDQSLLARRADAYRAFYEHLPMRQESIPRGPDMPIHRKVTWGDLAEFSMLDTRQYRSEPPCGYGEAERCPAAFDPSATMTGPEQERWLLRNLDSSDARWNLIGQQVLMAELDHDGHAPGDDLFWNDSWDGYPAARARIIQHIHSRKIANPVVITGDWHSTFANDIKLDFDDPRSPTVAAEFVTPSLSSNGDEEVYGPYYGPMIPFNPHIRFFDGDRHGSMTARLTKRALEVDWRIADRVGSPDAPVRTLRTFAVEAGRPGLAQY